MFGLAMTIISAGVFDSEARKKLLQSDKYLGDKFTDAVFDYISLINIDWDEAFACKCDAGTYKDVNHMILMYDNVCNLLRSLMLRYPELAKDVSFLIDTLHWKNHSLCSPFFNKGISIAATRVNSAINEQKNKYVNYAKTTAAFTGQARGMAYLRFSQLHLNPPIIPLLPF